LNQDAVFSVANANIWRSAAAVAPKYQSLFGEILAL